jgi:glycosyltransferase involved in cell wall biosynthesis
LVGISGSIIIPVHNEANILSHNILTLQSFLCSNLDEYEIILVENGSTDSTPQITQELTRKIKGIKAINLPDTSLGYAIKQGVKKAIHNKVVYYPIDLSINLEYIPESIKMLDKYDVVIGSKRHREGKDKRSIQRIVTSIGFHWLVKRLFSTELSDTTCVKAYRKSVIIELLDLIPSESNVFETELMMEAQKMGLHIMEIPVTVTDNRPSRQPLRYKIQLKLRDLLSVRIDKISLYLGVPLLIIGFFGLTWLSMEKIVWRHGGFINPYSFLLSMLFIISGFQIVAFGFLANLVLQLRRELTKSQYNLDKIHNTRVD